ncbi:UbiA family prenyltransferase [Sphingomonas sp. PvP056]|uniref:UbiA family prenyltransferase n=1 Tax=Sphingomonas sp. PvP056 TaxID=3156392 RepID=UPI0033989F25
MMSAHEMPPTLPLVVDVDGTLIKTDLLYETAMQFAASQPLQLLRLFGWLAHGRPTLKRELARAVELDVSALPLRSETLAAIAAARQQGRAVYLASASDMGLVERLAARIGGIAGVFATSRDVNLAGVHKANALIEAFGINGFDYIGDQPVDFPVWAQARLAIAVCHSSSFERSVYQRFPDAEVIARSRVEPRHLVRAMRPHQWAKNVLLFLPLISGHNFAFQPILSTVLAFVCFCMAASSAYILNDLLDLPSDRVHHRKRRRPFAAGDVPIKYGVLLGGALFVGAGVLSMLLPWNFVALLVLYLVATITYSLVLKRKLFIDVITLGGLYTIRVMAGLEAAGGAQSQWLLMICLFLFMSLATVKRCSELVLQQKAGHSATVGRGYRTSDLPVMLALGAAAGYATSMVLALYIASPEVTRLYANVSILWLIQPLFLYWISRVLILSNRGELHEDPVIFACTDRVSLLTGFCILIVAGVAV